jgi:hypothetical protein
MEKVDPQVQIKLIELAWKYAAGVEKRRGKYADLTTPEVFDEVYKSLIATLSEH